MKKHNHINDAKAYLMKTATKIQTDTATEANWPKCIREFIHGCNRALLRGQLKYYMLRPMFNMILPDDTWDVDIPIKEFVYECYEIDGTYVNRTGKFYLCMFDYRPDTDMSVVNVSKSVKTTSFEKPFSLN